MKVGDRVKVEHVGKADAYYNDRHLYIGQEGIIVEYRGRRPDHRHHSMSILFDNFTLNSHTSTYEHGPFFIAIAVKKL